MKFTLRDLGRLEEATIDLDKDLIVLTGPNNTSKTYVAHAIYGLCMHLRGFLSICLQEHLRPIADAQADVALTIDTVDLIEAHLHQILSSVGTEYRKRLTDVFATSNEFVARATVAVELVQERVTAGRQALLALKDEGEPTESTPISVHKEAGQKTWRFEPRPTMSSPLDSAKDKVIRRHIFVSQVADRISSHVAELFLGAPVFTDILTAERAAIQLFSRELSLNRTALVDNLLGMRSDAARSPSAAEAILGALEMRARRYPLGIRTSLYIANDLATRRATTSPFSHLADRLESDLLKGSIRISEDGEMLFHPEPSGPGLTLHLSSSSVKSLAALSFFLRHTAQKGQLLIIDEPELNLHPDNQRRVARVLARLARAGVKVLISTHSDYLIRELNNLIMLSADRDGEVRKRHGYEEEELLSPAQVGAYLFDASRAHPIEVAPTGIEVETIDREINALNAASQDIYFSLFGKTGV